MNSANRKTVIQRLSSKAFPLEPAGLPRSGNSRQASAARVSASNSALLGHSSAIPLSILRDVGAEDLSLGSGISSKRGQKPPALVAGSNPAYFSLDEKQDRLSRLHERGFSPSPDDCGNKQRLFTQLLQDSSSSGLIRFLRRRKAAAGPNLQSHSGVQRRPLKLGLTHHREKKTLECSQRRKKQASKSIRPEIVLCEVKLDSRPLSKHWPETQPAGSDRTKPDKPTGFQASSQLATVKSGEAQGVRFRIDSGWTGTAVRRLSAAKHSGLSEQANLQDKLAGNNSLTVERSRSSRRSRLRDAVAAERECPSPFPARKRPDCEELGATRSNCSHVQISLPLIRAQKHKRVLDLGRHSRELAPKTDVMAMRRAAAIKPIDIPADLSPKPPSHFDSGDLQELKPLSGKEENLAPKHQPADSTAQHQVPKQPLRERRNLIPRPVVPILPKKPSFGAVHINGELTGWSRPAIDALDQQDLDFEDLTFEDCGRY